MNYFLGALKSSLSIMRSLNFPQFLPQPLVPNPEDPSRSKSLVLKVTHSP